MSSNTSKTILLLAANPKGTTPLRLDEEVREIDAGLQRARNRDQFVLEQKWAVRPRDIQRGMLDSKPSIVHFSGHGTGDEGLVFEDETGITKLVDGEALAGLFELFADQVECVVLNGCYSEVQAIAIARHVNYVIGMNKEIGDRAAIEFAVGFYDALGAGRPVEFAYKFGCAAIRLAGIPEQLTPVLKKKPSIDDPSVKISSPSEPPVSQTPTVSKYMGNDGGYIACYSHNQEGSIYSIGGGIYVMGFIRLQGKYKGSIFEPKGYEGQDISAAQELKDLCNKTFPSAKGGGWAGGDTGSIQILQK
jgi:hypothetical protein